MKKSLTFILIPFILFIGFSCTKKNEKIRSIQLEQPYFVDYDKAEFNLSFVTDKKKREVFNYIGICWDTEQKPTYHYRNTNRASLKEEKYVEKESGNESMTLFGLYANTTYYARAFVRESDDDNIDENDYFYSSEVTFTTAPMIPPPCAVNQNQIDFSGNIENMAIGNLFNNQSIYGNYIEFATSSSLGDFRVLFPHKPLPGRYRTVVSDLSLTPDCKDIIIQGHISETYNCKYLAEPDQYVYVNNDGNGNVSISFCDLKFRTQDPCTQQVYELTGEITNF